MGNNRWESGTRRNFPGALLREVREELGKKTVLKNVEYFRQYTFESKSKILVSDMFTASMEGRPDPYPGEIAELEWFAKGEALKLDFCVNCQKRVEDFYNFLIRIWRK